MLLPELTARLLCCGGGQRISRSVIVVITITIIIINIIINIIVIVIFLGDA